MSLQQYSLEELKEMSLIEIAHAILADKKEAVNFQQLVQEIADLQEVSVEEIQHRLPQFYTDLNIDGRFNSTGDNRWGLKVWYPIDQIEDEMTNPVKPKKKKAKKVVDEFEEDFEDEDLLGEDDLEELEDEDLDDDLLDDEEDDIEDDLIEDDFDFVDDDEEDDNDQL